MEVTTLTNKSASFPEFLAGGGEMGQRIREYDWAGTPLGPVDTWPQSLRTCIRIMLTSRQPIWIGWGKQLIKFYNDPYKAIVGGKHPWALGKPASVVWKDIWRDIEPMLKQVMEQDEGTYVESQLLIMDRNGYAEETYYTFSYTPIPGNDGKTAGMFCANTDDTDKIISERQLRTLTQLGKRLSDSRTQKEIIEKTIATLTENPHDFPFALFYSFASDKASFSYATDLGETNGNIIREIDLNEANEVADLLKEAAATRKFQVFDGLKKKLGSMPKGAWKESPDKAIVLPIVQTGIKEPYGFLVVGLNPYRLLDEKYGSFFSLVADQVATDFADVHLLEDERKRAEALAEIDRAKTIFFSNISHEFRTPLTLLLGPIEDVLNDPATIPDNKERMSVAYRNALRMQKLVNTLLEFSRIEAGRVEGKFSRVDICSFTQDLASAFRSAIEKAGMQLNFHCQEINEEVYIDVEMWEKIVLNLVSNAFKYSKQGRIDIEVKKSEGQVHFSVSDTGVGIPEDQLDKIFDRFHRVENIQGRSQEGTGIGLAMVKELVRLHQGTIQVKSKPGKGSCFTVSIPLGKEHLPAEKISNIATKILVPTSTDAFVQEALKWIPGETGSTMQDSLDVSYTVAHKKGTETELPKVLLADDNVDMRQYVQRLLVGQFDVIIAVDGEDAFHKALLHKPDLLLSDIMMPKLDGFGLLKKVRSHPDTKNIPVIFLSARAGEEAKIEGLDAGADDYLVKPFSAKELMVRVSNHIRMSQVRRETEQQFYQLFLQAPAIINVFKGPELRYELYHPKNKEFFGGRDFTGMTLKEALPELEGQGIFELLDEVYQKGITVIQNERQVWFKNEKGELQDRYFNFSYQPWYDIKGKIQGVLNFALEVTETIKTRKKIEESELYFRRLADTVPATIWRTEKDGSCSYLNKSWYDITGQTPEEAQGFGWLNATHPDDIEEVGKVFQNANTRQVPFQAVYRLRQKNGDYRWVIDRGSSRFDETGAFEGYIGSVIDVHEQKTAAEKIRESEEQFRTLAETLPQLVWITDAAGEQVYASSRWKEYSGIEPAGNTWPKIVHPDDLAPMTKVWGNSLSTGGFYRTEARLLSKSGEYRWFFVQGEPIRSKEGKIVKWIGSFTDIHDQKEIEKKLEGLVRERTMELQRSNNDLQQFAHVASHDLREPLRKIKTFTGRLAEDPGTTFSEKAKTFIGKVNSASDRMFMMIEGVLNYSMLTAAEQKIQLVNLNDVLQSIQTDLELPMVQKSAVLYYQNLPAVEGAPVLLYQLFYNLINNSLKFSKPGIAPVIRITSTVVKEGSREYALIHISDNGIGFDQEFAERIFDTFTRLNSKDQYEGTGLGLSLCKRIAERHGGAIEAAAEKGKGATFSVRLPLKQEDQSI